MSTCAPFCLSAIETTATAVAISPSTAPRFTRWRGGHASRWSGKEMISLRPRKDGLREEQDLRQTKERFHILPLLAIALVIPENLDITDSRNGGRMLGNELSQVGVCGLGCIDEDVTIDEHYPSRPGKLRS